MRSAPPVALVCDGGAGWRGLQVLLYMLAVAAFAGWLASHVESGRFGMAAVVLPASAAAGAIAWRALRPRPQRLAWDGERWTAGPQAEAGEVEVMIDLGAWLLLRFTPAAPGAPARWLALSAAAAGGGLHGLRSAVYGRAPQDGATVRSPERQPD